MKFRIETPSDEPELAEFIELPDRVNARRSARWPAPAAMHRMLLTGESPFCRGRTIRPIAARQGGQVVARAVAMVDSHYQRHWNEKLGHVVMFEAMPEVRDAVRAMLDEAARWLSSQGCDAARAGYGTFEFPFVIDDYETLPPDLARQNPPYYHAMLKDCGFETERGWVDYKIRVTADLVARYRSALEAGKRAGFEFATLASIEPSHRVAQFMPVWNEAFSRHWGAAPFTADEMSFLFEVFDLTGANETSLVAYRDGEPVGALMVSPPASDLAALDSGRRLGDHERLNFLGIGVRPAQRGRGVNLAMAAHAYLNLIRNYGSKFLSYTLVLDDNHPSRRTAEKLGASVCASYVTYRRNFRV